MRNRPKWAVFLFSYMAKNVQNNVAVNVTVNTDESKKAFSSLREELKAVEREMQQLAMAGEQNSERFKELQKRGGEIKDTMGDIRQRINALASDTKKLDAFTDGVKGIAAGFSVAEGASALFGDQNEELQKQILKVQGAIALLNGVQEVANILNKDSAFMTIASANAQAVYAAVVGTSTGAMKAFRIALISTGIGAIVVALGLLVSNFGAVKDAVLRLIPGLSAIGDFFSSVWQSITDFTGATSDATRAMDKLVEASKKSAEASKQWLDLHADKYDEFTKRKVEADIAYKEAIGKIDEDEKLSLEEKQKLIAEYYDKRNREIRRADADRAKAEKEAADKLAEQERKAYEERLKKQREYLAKRQKADLEAYSLEAAARERFYNDIEIADLEAKSVSEVAMEEEFKTFNDIETAKEALRNDMRLKDAQQTKAYWEFQKTQTDLNYEYGRISLEEYVKSQEEADKNIESIERAAAERRKKNFDSTMQILRAGIDISNAFFEANTAKKEAELKAQGKTDDQVKREMFEREKKHNLSIAYMNGAMAIASILAQYPKYDGGFALAAALASAVAANAAQIIKIKATQYNSGASSGSATATFQPNSSGTTSNSDRQQLTPQPNFQKPIQAYLTDKQFSEARGTFTRMDAAASF